MPECMFADPSVRLNINPDRNEEARLLLYFLSTTEVCFFF